MTSRGFQLESQTLGPLPVIDAFLDRLGTDRLLAEAVPSDPRSHLPMAAALGVLLRNLIEARTPLYALAEWARERDPQLLGIPASQPGFFNDDRVGRALDHLFDADRAALQTAVVVSAIRQFGVHLDELHNDSTTITFSGAYPEADGGRLRGQPTVRIAHGHNKDHRDDLKQLLWILTVSADSAFPVHCRIADGPTSDTEPHREVWDLLVQLAGRADFLYVADSKLCTRENMDHIASHGGRFLTVLPRSRKEDPDFRTWVVNHAPDWVTVRGGTADARLMCEAPWPSADGYRVVWILSTSKAKRDADTRRVRIRKASERLDELAERLHGPKSRIRSKGGADAAVRAILKETVAEPYVEVSLEEVATPSFRQERRGHPGENTRYRRVDQTRITLTWKLRDDLIATEAKSDGMFPLITNCRDLSLAELLDHYKYQPCLERRHEQLKSGLAVVPMWLKNIGRIEAILLLYFIALLVRALLEREVRRRMTDQDLATIPLYPEDRDCPAPSAERILAIFGPLERHRLLSGDRLVQTFEPRLSPIQRRVLKLLGLSPSIYRLSPPS